jgi:iron complex outermembrane recepter protein
MMKKRGVLQLVLLGGACSLSLATAAQAENFDVPGGDLYSALKAYSTQSGIAVVVSDTAMKGARTRGVKGVLSSDAALSQILHGTGFVPSRDPSGVVDIVRDLPDVSSRRSEQATPIRVAAASTAGIESVVVTSSKIKGDIQTVPIAITALSQEQLTSRQIAGGPDLVKEVPNLTFSKTNFSGYTIQIRGIGTQAISVTTDPAVAVAFNDIPFIRNHFFEQEFYDVSQVEVLRGPQGTLYGRNATAGVVNVISAKPTDQFEAMLSADWGNYTNRRYEGMINIPIVDDRLDLRIAGEWTKRNGYTINENTNTPIDGRDLWSGRVTLGWKPASNVQTYLVWEHFSEDDDRMRTAKQLCHTAPSVFGESQDPFSVHSSQGCEMSSLYSADAFQVPNSAALPYACALAPLGAPVNCLQDVYAGVTQSTNLRVIQTAFEPKYRAKNDIVELNADYNITPVLTLTSQTGYNHDFLFSTEDYNRFNTNPGIFKYDPINGNIVSPSGVFCDPQIGCSDRLIAEDLSDETAWQLSQEFRLASNFAGPLNFSAGGNYLHYETKENYFVFFNTLTAYLAGYGQGPQGQTIWVPGVSDNSQCLHDGLIFPDLSKMHSPGVCAYIDPNPIGSLNGNGHNYFRSDNPYRLNSYAAFGEGYYNIAPDLKFTGGLRWTEDKKHFTDIPSEVIVDNWGYPSNRVVDQQWDQLTGRAVVTWTPKLSFTDQTMIYDSFAHGYKAGGANPPGAILLTICEGQSVNGTCLGQITQPDHPLAFKPEFVDAYELGTKNTLLDGGLSLNGDVFYYNYKGYQISRIVDRTSINDNFDATVKGAELEAMYEPLPGLKFNFGGGYEDTRIDNGQSSIDLIDRTAGHPGWLVIGPFPTQASNCIMPVDAAVQGCGTTYVLDAAAGIDPVTGLPYVPNPPGHPGYPGFDPRTAPNNGEGFAKNLGGNQLPNAPHFTTSLSGEYTLPVSQDWAATLHSDFYWQSQSFARVFNDRPYDKLRGYSTANVALILTSASGWQVMGYVKNVFDVTAITGDFLNSDDSGLTTNVFLTDPRLYGVRVTKNW